MPVFTKNGIRGLFIHIPKTGGSSVEVFFSGRGWEVSYLDQSSLDSRESANFVRRVSPQHLHAKITLEMFRVERFDFVFSIVRDPGTRIKSEYAMRHPDRIDSSSVQEEFAAWLRLAEAEYKRDPMCMDNHIRPQVDFLFPEVEVIRLEEGLSRVVEIEEEFSSGLSSPNPSNNHNIIPFENASWRSSRDFVLGKSVENQIRRLYRRDFRKLGY
jgi:hypothetical protein